MDWPETGIHEDKYGHYADLRVKGVTQRFRWIKPGKFMMGSPENEKYRGSNEVQHEVTLTRGYWLADTTCTQAFWLKVMGENPSNFKGLEKPVEEVSWEDAMKFISQPNEFRPDITARLPTEAEWEYACRAGTTTPFSFGEDISTDQVHYDGNYPYKGSKGKYREDTVEVKELPCNAWGLYQMHGNIREWCMDWYGSYEKTQAIDPTGPKSAQDRVLCGGLWYSDAKGCRSAARYSDVPDERLFFIGFRLALGH